MSYSLGVSKPVSKSVGGSSDAQASGRAGSRTGSKGVAPARSPGGARGAGASGAGLEAAAARFRRTRAAHEDETAEDYCEAIAAIGQERGQTRVRDLAKFMGVSHVTVTRIIARLGREGLVITEPYKPIFLTTEGKKMAERTRRRHETVLNFLLAIGVPLEQAQTDTEGIEHHVSEATIRALKRVTEGVGRGEARGTRAGERVLRGEGREV